ncbi:D-alanyl-D-alanine carboxypeptidase/D-alanyl-D-alanine-endopeptidase [Isoptericola variabilis]|uniref:D-alanyl-D-alanine carboxypeptidase/D-alanyl-D-alanine-endopeptidase n=1 Tax=Isoptericola variabilis (strain 225) TaxID=743718 RepID=F6FTZ2_ISOV2|nr:D-alanyl-D-alanine carboxypeptidase/D-alanyl-D-alanine-endopeptidase [Isoptericola variabilis]AEG45363.1 D-alanyl-D-alanine carboxypeptidase/D-alanyl-D-alanine-endopeptidase [Isoptericola variabilis 225]TWH34866.1 D-alanyl-D-alanine carboxypeptidase/D-alanyl-D-alanine-endopeptidase (penicillin-binding protein 4) [Isoptericola variabilis J7]
MGWRLRVGATVTTVVALFGGYLVADAYDVVPGLLTTAPPPPQPAPFPSAPGAVLGPAATPVLSDLPSDAPVPTTDAVGELVTALASDARLGERVGVLVQDALTGEVLGSAAPDQEMVPASTQKVLTAVAALSSPGGDATLATTAVLAGESQVVLVGGGDMMLAADAGDPDAVNGHAGLGDLAAQVASRILVSGRTSVTLGLDDTIFTGPAIAPTVRPGDAAAGYVAPVAALAIDVARLTDDEYARRAEDPALAAAQEFARQLEARGLQVEGSVERTRAPSSAQPLGEVRSAPLSAIVQDMLERSDNTLTEVLGRLVAIDAGLPGSLDGAVQAVTASVERLGVDLEGAVLADLSGLGEGSRMTARQLVDALALAVDPAHPTLRAAATGLPLAGLTGTLANRFPDDNPGRGVVTGKTGSLPNITSLAGTIVTADDRLLVYAVLADAVPDGGTWGARVIFDDFLGRLAACGCTPG